MSDVRAALEAAIAENFDDLAAHAAYADLLTEQGDPRGELIQVQLALEDRGRSRQERQQLRQRERELLETDAERWLGGLAPLLTLGDDVQPEEVRVARGWPITFMAREDLSVPVARMLANAPESQSLRALYLPGDGYERLPATPQRQHRVYYATAELARSSYLGNVRVFRLGEDQEGEWDGHCDCHAYSWSVVDLVAIMPRLEQLYLLAKGFDSDRLFALSSLSNLRVLLMYHAEEYHPLDILAANSAFANLTHLMLHPHGFAPADEPFLDLDALSAVVRSPILRSLTHLQLRLCTAGDDGCQEIVASGVLKRLKMLDLRHGRITDAGARTLAACADLRNLDVLDVNRNALSADGVALLRATGVQVVGDDQQTAEELARDEYLNEGDFE
jgi:uncharacterized protein (TIGR02996 family)